MLPELALVALALTVVAGLTMLVRLLRSGRRLPRLIWLHLVTVLLPFCGWAAYTATEARPRWLAAVVLLVTLGVAD